MKPWTEGLKGNIKETLQRVGKKYRNREQEKINKKA